MKYALIQITQGLVSIFEINVKVKNILFQIQTLRRRAMSEPPLTLHTRLEGPLQITSSLREARVPSITNPVRKALTRPL